MALILHYFAEFVFDVIVKIIITPTSVTKSTFDRPSLWPY